MLSHDCLTFLMGILITVKMAFLLKEECDGLDIKDLESQ